MKIDRLLTGLLLACFTLTLQAQIQPGYVKTLGRPNKKGVALSGVSVRVKGGHNATLSRNDGTFSMQVKGQSYALQLVQKSGYELNEKGVIGRSYAYSAYVPLTIVMVSTRELQADKQRIEENAYQTAEKNYKQKIALLEKQRTDNSISIEQYRQRIQDLQDKFDKYQSLIDNLAEHYARTDYDFLDEKEREINICIENGNLEKAETLLQQLGIQERIASIERRLAAGQSLMDQATQDLAAVLKQQDKDAERLYQLYTIALANFDRDKAKFYIETRAALDTTNVQWQIDAGEFFCEHTIILNTAMNYFQCALRQSAPESMEMAECYNDMAAVYLMTGKINEATNLSNQSLDIRKKIFGENHSSMAIAYNTLGVCMELSKEYEKSIECHQKSMDIRKMVYGDMSAQTVIAYHNIAAALYRQGKYEQALENLEKAKPIAESLTGFTGMNMMATVYDAIASAIGAIADRDGKVAPPQVMEYHLLALKLYLKMFGENHDKTAKSFHNVGTAYVYQISYLIMTNDTVSMVNREELTNGILYLKKSLEIKRHFKDEFHTSIKETKNVLGLLGKDCYILGVRNQQKNDIVNMGIYYAVCNEILSIINDKENYPLMSNALMGVGLACQLAGSYENAIDYYSKALSTSLSTNEKANMDLILQSINATYTEWIKTEPNNKEIQILYQQFKEKYNQ